MGKVTCPCWAEATVGYVCDRSMPRASSYGQYNWVSGRHRIIYSDQHLITMTTINCSQTVPSNRMLLTMVGSIRGMFYRQLTNVLHARITSRIRHLPDESKMGRFEPGSHIFVTVDLWQMYVNIRVLWERRLKLFYYAIFVP